MKCAAAFTAIVVLCVLPRAADAETGSAPFCLQTQGGARCVFSTMSECEQARGSATAAQCITSTDAHGTTGLGEPPAKSSGTQPIPPAGSRPTYGR